MALLQQDKWRSQEAGERPRAGRGDRRRREAQGHWLGHHHTQGLPPGPSLPTPLPSGPCGNAQHRSPSNSNSFSKCRDVLSWYFAPRANTPAGWPSCGSGFGCEDGRLIPVSAGGQSGREVTVSEHLLYPAPWAGARGGGNLTHRPHELGGAARSCGPPTRSHKDGRWTVGALGGLEWGGRGVVGEPRKFWRWWCDGCPTGKGAQAPERHLKLGVSMRRVE